MVACPAAPIAPPNMHLFTLQQDDVKPCWWIFDSVAMGFKILLDATSLAPLALELRHQDNNLYFQGHIWGAMCEHQVFTNNNVACPGGIYAYVGWATIFWLDAAVGVIEDFNLPTDSQILFEFFMKNDASPVYKFCFPKYTMNVKFLLNP